MAVPAPATASMLLAAGYANDGVSSGSLSARAVIGTGEEIQEQSRATTRSAPAGCAMYTTAPPECDSGAVPGSISSYRSPLKQAKDFADATSNSTPASLMSSFDCVPQTASVISTDGRDETDDPMA